MEDVVWQIPWTTPGLSYSISHIVKSLQGHTPKYSPLTWPVPIFSFSSFPNSPVPRFHWPPLTAKNLVTFRNREFFEQRSFPGDYSKNGGLIVGIWKFHVSWAHGRRWLVRYSEVRKHFKVKNMSWFLLEFICTKRTTIDRERTTIAVYFSLSLSFIHYLIYMYNR